VLRLPCRSDGGFQHSSVRQIPSYRKRSATYHLLNTAWLMAMITAGALVMFGLAFAVFVVWLSLVAVLLLAIVMADALQEAWKLAQSGRSTLERHALTIDRAAGLT